MRQGKDSLLIVVVIILGITIWGPTLAEHFKLSLVQVAAILSPIAGSAVVVVLIATVLRNYWSRW